MPDLWWSEGNDLALIEAMRNHARTAKVSQAILNSHLIGAARVIGMKEDDIRTAFESDRCLTIYEP